MLKLLNNLPINTSDIEDGIDRKQLNLLRQRFLQINQARLDRSLQTLTDRQQQFLKLIPLLFHVNHPLLPGYLSNQVPCGLVNYLPQKHEIQLAKTFSRSFHYQKELSIKQSAIDALFVMGSPGTIAQNEISDLDLWICHKIDLSEEKRELLQRKSDLLSDWANKNIHLTLHCFLMQSDAFRDEQVLAFNSEASGTAQYYLLLDEFYRTALWLAGKIPLWWFVPSDREKDYAYFSKTLIEKRFLKKNDIIDFGGVPEIPQEEYLGAGIWQLYKAIESPYKSVLKLLLLEIYATQSSSDLGEPLALGFKRLVYSGITDADKLDSYAFIYQRIEDYLLSIENNERLELIRRCFYFKVNRSISKEIKSTWQGELLKSMVAQWSWDLSKLRELDNRSHWKANLVTEEHGLLVTELTHSYQLLNELHNRLGLEASINREQLTVLGRKLFAAFERRTGKVNFINPGISLDLTEDNLYFVQHKFDSSSAWSVDIDDGNQQEKWNPKDSLKHSPQLIELLLWSYANGLINNSTRLHFQSSNFVVNFSQHELISNIGRWLSQKPQEIDHHFYHSPAYIDHFFVIANLGLEPQSELNKKGMHLISNRNDALGYSGFRDNLVQCLDVVYLNSWGEIICCHFEKDPVIQFMQYYLQIISRQTFILPQIMFHCFSKGKGGIIAQRLEEIWKQFHHCFFSSNQNNQRFLFEMADEYILIESPTTSTEPVFRASSIAVLLQRLALPRQVSSKLFIDPLALRKTPLPQINQLYTTKAIQVFFQLHQHQADIYFLDAKGSLALHTCQFHSPTSLLRPIAYFLRNIINKLEFEIDENQQAPDLLFYEILGGNTLLSPNQPDWKVKQFKINDNFGHLPLFSIKVFVEHDENHQTNYVIFCNEKEFSSFLYGNKVFDQVAAYIKQQRKTGENYPCYITDLDIYQHYSSQQGLQLIEFWQMKIQLEERINTAFRLILGK